MGTVSMGDREAKLEKVFIQTCLSDIHLHPEFSISIELYDLEEEDGMILSYDHLVKEGIEKVEDLQGQEVSFSTAELNQYGNTIYLDDREFEALALSIGIHEKAGGYEMKGRGSIQGEEGEIVAVHFAAVVEWGETEYIAYDASNYHFQKEAMVYLLTTLAEEELLLAYKKPVPFVHVPIELFDQWESAYGVTYKWFYEMYEENQIYLLQQINDRIAILKKEERVGLLADVPDILTNKEWQELMVHAQVALKNIKE